MIKRLKKFLTKKNSELLKVYSHPRSGTHFLEAFLAKNFYQDKELSLVDVTWGHWSNRQVKPEGNPYGKLFGNHYFSDLNNNDKPKIYIVRDGRAVAYSIWKTPNFLHKDISHLTFKEFLKTPIDWRGTPSKQAEPNLTILEHWAQHVKGWYEFSEQNDNVMIIAYGDLISDPYKQYLRIHEKYFKNAEKLTKESLDIIKKPVGLLPNKAKIDAWKAVFDEDDNNFFKTTVDKLLMNKIKFK